MVGQEKFGFSNQTAWAGSVILDGNIPLVVYQYNNYNGDKLGVLKYNEANLTWEDISNSNYGIGLSGVYRSSIYNHVPYVLASNVQKYENGSWAVVGTNIGSIDQTSLSKGMDIDANGICYVINKNSVKRFLNNTWEDVGTNPILGGTFTYSNIKIDAQGTPYIVYFDKTKNYNLFVQKYVNGAWQIVGDANGFTAGEANNNILNIKFDGIIPYIAYVDGNNNKKARVKRFVNNTWEDVGGTAVSAGEARYLGMEIANKEIFLAYTSGVVFAKKYTIAQVLPVMLSKFEATKSTFGEAVLNWETATESNNDYFTLEKSIDGITFKSFGKISSKGDGNSKQYYQFVDQNPNKGINYYRLSQTDKDGKIKELVIKSINIDDFESTMAIYPNPLNQQILNISIANLNGNKEICFFDYDGKMVTKQNSWFESGKANLKLSNNLAKGIYVLKIEGTPYKSKLVVE